MAIRPRRVSHILVRVLALFLIGTVVVLALVQSHFRVSDAEYIRETELGTWDEIRASKRPAVLDRGDTASDRSPGAAPPEKIPRIIHQTWKSDTLPPEWEAVRRECARLMPDYEYRLWTDESSREFIAQEYAWFLPTFDSYPYNIQRADAIRYFVLHKYGGVYMDLDIGCRRRLDTLLRFDVVLPKTIPVGLSNDLMLSVPGHPYMDLLIHSLSKFNHYFFTHYATVMFSTGPMFVSTLYRIYVSLQNKVAPSNAAAIERGFHGVRVLPKTLYGKNIAPQDAPDSFFVHMYGSSWHAGDAGFLIFLRKNGYIFITIGVLIVLISVRKQVLVGATRVVRGVLSLVKHRSSVDTASGFDAAGGAHASVKLTTMGAPPWPHPRAPDVESKILDSGGEFSARPAMRVPTIAMNGSSSLASYDAPPIGPHSPRRNSDTNAPLPTFYIDNPLTTAARKAPAPAPAPPAGSAAEPSTPSKLRRLSRATMHTLATLVPPPMRRNGLRAPRPDGASEPLLSLGVDSADGLTRTVSNHSDECHAEWDSLVHGWGAAPEQRSPVIAPAASPMPQLIGESERPSFTATGGNLLRRPHPTEPFRTLTPAVSTTTSITHDPECQTR